MQVTHVVLVYVKVVVLKFSTFPIQATCVVPKIVRFFFSTLPIHATCVVL